MKLNEYAKKHIHYYTDEIPPFLINVFNKHPIKNLADLGSGDGPLLFALFKKGLLDKLDKVVAVDISPERIRNVKKISHKITGIVADACRLKMLKNRTFDLLISTQVIEHVKDEDKFLKEARRILADKGLFYLSTVFKKWYGWYFYRCNGRWVLDPTHLREYTNTTPLLEKIKKYNFKVLENKKTLFCFPISDFILKRIGRKRNIYNNKTLQSLRNLKIPILGYYNWELILKKKGA